MSPCAASIGCRVIDSAGNGAPYSSLDPTIHYGGINDIIYLSKRIKDPDKDPNKGNLLGIVPIIH